MFGNIYKQFREQTAMNYDVQPMIDFQLHLFFFILEDYGFILGSMKLQFGELDGAKTT